MSSNYSMTMRSFLSCVAAGYADLMLDRGVSPDNFCFVFPNKRAGTFFLRDFRRALYSGRNRSRTPQALPAPEITTITELTTRLSGRLTESRINLLFLLYKCYLEVMGTRASGVALGDGSTTGGEAINHRPSAINGGGSAPVSFDAFRRWGEIVLSDFNEIDMHVGDAETLFKNLSDLKRLTSSFLTEEQRKVIEEYFGYRMPDYDTEKFWLEFGEGTGDRGQETGDRGQETHSSETRRKFVRIWRVLWPLYQLFNERMRELGIATSGLTYRLALERLEAGEEGLEKLLPHGKYVFIGFNALSGAERGIFSEFKSLASPLFEGESLGEFVWDAGGPVIGSAVSTAGHFVNRNIRMYPAPEWLLRYIAPANPGGRMPEVRAVASPSKVGQVKIASQMISELHEEIGDEAFENAKVALVMPDQGLLLPLLYSLPGDMKDANLTMGYPLKLTAVGSFLALIRRLQMIRRDSKQYMGYAYAEVKNLLGHPYAQMIIGPGKIARFTAEFERRHVPVVRDSDLLPWLGEKGEELLRPLAHDARALDVVRYIDNTLRLVGETFGERTANSEQETGDRGQLTANRRQETGMTKRRSIEALHLAAWREALQVFADSIREYGIEMSAATTISEAWRLLQGEVVAFEGEPLKGLQIMGLLETRALDFEEVFVTDVNERVLPMRQRQRSFLPNVIRYGYGLPPLNYSEKIFSYYFYRLIGRAKRVTLIYDNRTGGLNGGVSRYLMQLRYLFSRDAVKEIEYRFNPEAPQSGERRVRKRESLWRQLLLFTNPKPNREGRRKNLSATSLSKYMGCSLRFMLEAVEGLGDDPDAGYGVNNLNYGNVVHEVMERLYLPEDMAGKGLLYDPPIEITKEKIQRALEDREGLETLIKRMMNKHHNNERTEEHWDDELEEDAQIVADAALIQVRNLLRHDLELAPFNLYGCEIKESFTYTTRGGRSVNVVLKIDRLDDADTGGREMTLRVVDYKSGNAHLNAESMAHLFSGDYNCSNTFQLLFYGLMLNEKRKQDGLRELDIVPRIYSAPNIHKDKEKSEFKKNHIPVLAGNEIEVLEPGGELMEEFRERLDGVIEGLFSRDVDFVGRYSEEGCRMCPFGELCR